MPRFRWGHSLVCLVCLASTIPAQEGRLGRVREEVRRPAPPAPPPLERPQREADEEDNESPLGWILGIFASDDRAHCEFARKQGTEVDIGPLALVLFAPYTVPSLLLEDDWKETYYFAPFPYRRHYPGYCTIHPDRGKEIADFWKTTHVKSTSLQATLEDGNNFSGLNRVGGMILLDSTCRLGILAHWDWFHERFASGQTDNLGIGDVNATLTFARTNWAQMRTGLGMRWMADQCGADFGFNFHYSGDFFPVRPLVISTSLDAGTLGDAGVLRLRATAGIVRRHVEVYGGYDYFSIGGVDLHGPLVGVRLWY